MRTTPAATWIAALAAAAALAGPARADDRIDRLERDLEAQRERGDAMQRELDSLKRERASGVKEEAGKEGSRERESASLADWAVTNYKDPALRGSVYAKPFLMRFARGGFGAYLGGYMDLEYVDGEGKDRTFLQHRFIPFIYSDVTDLVKVAAEIEFEYGGPNLPQKDGEVKVEFAFVDLAFGEAFNFRAGALLVPVGKFNLIHDSPVNDLTARPLVDQLVIPTTWTEAGLGAYGTLYPGGDESEWKLDYELYAVQGFRGLTKSGAAFKSNISEGGGLRSARPSLKTDNNNSLAGVGRLGISPFLGLEVGLSGHVGRYADDSSDPTTSDKWMGLWAVDALIQLPGGLEVQGEFARADINRGPTGVAAGVPSRLWGWYGQVNYHFMFDGLKKALPVAFGEESTFTAVARLDYLHDGRKGVPDRQMVTPGLNYRPREETAVKFEYQLDLEGWDHTRVKDDAFLFSIATYF